MGPIENGQSPLEFLGSAVQRLQVAGSLPDVTSLLLSSTTMSVLLAVSVAWFVTKASTDRPLPHGATETVEPPELVPPAERIMELLEAQDGRMYQKDIGENLDKSASSVSRYLASLEDADRIERIQLGRTKLVLLPDRVPQAVPIHSGADMTDDFGEHPVTNPPSTTGSGQPPSV